MKNLATILIAATALLGGAFSSHAVVDDAHSFAMTAAAPYVEKGYVVRHEYWNGSAGVKESNGLTQQLFKGNDYWFWLGTDEEGAEVTIHCYDSAGKLVDKEAFKNEGTAGVRIVPEKTGTYYLIFSVEKSKSKKTRWAVAYGYK